MFPTNFIPYSPTRSTRLSNAMPLNSVQSNPLWRAIENKDEAALQDALDQADVDSLNQIPEDQVRTALSFACEKGFSSGVNNLLTKGADPTLPCHFYQGKTPLQTACLIQDESMIVSFFKIVPLFKWAELLYPKGTNSIEEVVENLPLSPLNQRLKHYIKARANDFFLPTFFTIFATENWAKLTEYLGNPRIFPYFLNLFNNINQDQLPLYCEKKYEKGICLLFSKLNQSNNNAWTAYLRNRRNTLLLKAIDQKSFKTALLLLQGGANPNTKTKKRLDGEEFECNALELLLTKFDLLNPDEKKDALALLPILARDTKFPIADDWKPHEFDDLFEKIYTSNNQTEKKTAACIANVLKDPHRLHYVLLMACKYQDWDLAESIIERLPSEYENELNGISLLFAPEDNNGRNCFHHSLTHFGILKKLFEKFPSFSTFSCSFNPPIWDLMARVKADENKDDENKENLPPYLFLLVTGGVPLDPRTKDWIENGNGDFGYMDRDDLLKDLSPDSVKKFLSRGLVRALDYTSDDDSDSL